MTIIEFKNLEGTDINTDLPTLSGQSNLFVKTNDEGTEYILSNNNTVPNPISTELVLNSTGIDLYGWTANPKMNKCCVTGGNSGGFIFGNENSNTLIKLNGSNIDFLNNNNLRFRLTTSGLNSFGTHTFNNILNQQTITGTNVFGANDNTINGNITMGTNSNITLSGSGNISTGSGGNMTSGFLKSNNTGTEVFCNIRVIDDNTGIYQPVSASGTMTMSAGGVNCLNFSSTRVLTQNICLFGRCYALQNTVYTAPNAWTVFTSSNPLFILVAPASSGTTIDLDFQIATNYFGGQTFRIITRLPAGNLGTCRYRAQSDTFHLTSGGASLLITANTYHTLTLDRTHEVICNVDTNRFYLIQG